MDAIILKHQNDYNHVWVTQRKGTACFEWEPAQIMWLDYRGSGEETAVAIRVV